MLSPIFQSPNFRHLAESPQLLQLLSSWQHLIEAIVKHSELNIILLFGSLISKNFFDIQALFHLAIIHVFKSHTKYDKALILIFHKNVLIFHKNK